MLLLLVFFLFLFNRILSQMRHCHCIKVSIYYYCILALVKAVISIL